MSKTERNTPEEIRAWALEIVAGMEPLTEEQLRRVYDTLTEARRSTVKDGRARSLGEAA